MRKELFMPSLEGEARLLLLINAFTTPRSSLEGRVKLAKLDFLLRYPQFFVRALEARKPEASASEGLEQPLQQTIESRMVRYRYGPWDPSYYALLGRLIGKGLVHTIPTKNGLGFKATETGQAVARQIAETDTWQPVAYRVKLLKKHFDLSGTSLKDFIYRTFPEVASASWGESL